MKVLFVCHYNVGRSQMAKAFYNHLTGTYDADAAGTHVLEQGQTIAERKAASASKNFFVIDVMKDEGIDISHYLRRQIAQDDLQRYDVIIGMTKASELPQWLLGSSKYTHWEVEDPRGQDYKTTAKVRDLIKEQVRRLIKQNSSK
jgi:arsenate reductase